MELIKAKVIPDMKLFNWYYDYHDPDKIYPPVLAKINGTFYQLNKFNVSKDYYLYLGETDYQNGLNTSINLKKDKNVVEISNILHIATSLNIEIREIEYFNNNNIRGKKLIEALKIVKDYPETIKRYVITKEVSFKTIILISQYLSVISKILEQYIDKYSPTISEFRKYLYIFIDYKDYIDLEELNIDKINSIIIERNKHLYEIYSKFNTLKKEFLPITIENNDYFESSQLIFSFAILNFIDYKKIVEILKNNSELLEKFYNYLKDNDIY
jgi:hypothetical protein